MAGAGVKEAFIVADCRKRLPDPVNIPRLGLQASVLQHHSSPTTSQVVRKTREDKINLIFFSKVFVWTENTGLQ